MRVATTFTYNLAGRSLRSANQTLASKTSTADVVAIEATSEAGEACNDQIRRAWEELLAAVRVRQLSEEELVHARRFLIRSWSVPVAVVLPRPETLSVRVSVSPEPPAPPPIPAAEELQPFDLQNALASYERQFIEAVLKETGGNISETSRRLGLSRNGLKNKIRQYGL